MNTVKVFTNAKLNFTLDIVGRTENYHLIDSLVSTIDLCDRIMVRKRKDRQIKLIMHGMGSEGIPPEENNAQRAGERFIERFQTMGADITIYKNIPIGAGLGGSSADAAGVLRALSKLYEIREERALKELADELGSDTGYLLTGGFARLRGRGDMVEPLGTPPDLNFLLLCPQTGVSTAACYRESDGYPSLPPHTERALSCFLSQNTQWAIKLFYNGLYPAAKKLNPRVGEAAAELASFSPLAVNMTGSGSGVYAVFETRELCEWAKSRYRGKSRAYVLRTAEDRKAKSIISPFALDPGEGE